jgi:hypothetical protein
VQHANIYIPLREENKNKKIQGRKGKTDHF